MNPHPRPHLADPAVVCAVRPAFALPCDPES
jgi:hypothetical protein